MWIRYDVYAESDSGYAVSPTNTCINFDNVKYYCRSKKNMGFLELAFVDAERVVFIMEEESKLDDKLKHPILYNITNNLITKEGTE